MKLKLFFFISCFKIMLPVFPQAAYNLRNIHVFNPANIMVDVFTIDNKVYALMDYRPNDTISGFKLYRANLDYDIEDSLVYAINKIQTFITNAVINDDKTISIAITKHTGLILKPSSFILLNIDKQLKLLSEQNITYRNLDIDYLQFANLVKLKNKELVLNLVMDKKFVNEYRCYNVYIKCNHKEGALKYLEDTIDMYNYGGVFNNFAAFNLSYYNDTLLLLKVPSLYINKPKPNALIFKRLTADLELLSSRYYLTCIITYNNSFITYFKYNDGIYFYGVFTNYTMSDRPRNNPNIVEIMPNDSFIVKTNINNHLNLFNDPSARDIGNNKAIAIKNNESIFGVTTHLLYADSNYFSIAHFNKDFQTIWNRYYRLPAKYIYINGMIASGNDLIVYGWQRDYFEKIFRPLFVTVTQDGWLTGINETIVKAEPELNLYPNPAKQKFSVQTDAAIQTIHITDMHGKLIKTFGSNADIKNINISDLSTGMYLVQIQTIQGIINKKLVVE